MNKSLWIAGFFALSITAWIGSGFFEETVAVEPKSVLEKQSAPEVHVQVTPVVSIDHPKVIRVFGETQPDRTVTLKAETDGQVQELLARKGDLVEAGTPLAKLDLNTRLAQRESASALVRQRELEYEAAVKLSKKSFRSQTSLAEARAHLSEAQANLKAINLDIANTTLLAPITGIIEDNMVEVGNFLKNDANAFTIIDLDPIVIAVYVSEQNIDYIQVNQQADITLSNGKAFPATVRFVSKIAQETTRTYRIELEASNPDYSIVSGQTAHVTLPVSTQKAMKVSPALLSLSKTGEVGLKTVNSNNEVEFHPVVLLDDTLDGIWVKGLPDNTQLITRGQNYVVAGQKVITTVKGE